MQGWNTGAPQIRTAGPVAQSGSYEPRINSPWDLTGQIVSRISKTLLRGLSNFEKQHSTLERHKAFGRKEGYSESGTSRDGLRLCGELPADSDGKDHPGLSSQLSATFHPRLHSANALRKEVSAAGYFLQAFASHGREGTVSAILRIASDAAGKYAGPSNSSKDAARCCIRVEDAAPVTHSECCEEQASGMQARYRAAHGNLTEYRALLFRLAGGHGVVHK